MIIKEKIDRQRERRIRHRLSENAFNPYILCRILHSTSYFFIILFPTAFYDRSRMTSRYLTPLSKNRFFHFCSLLPLPTASPPPSPTSGDGLRFVCFYFCSYLPLSSARSAAILAKAKRLTHFYCIASFLEKWFACFPCPGTAYD